MPAAKPLIWNDFAAGLRNRVHCGRVSAYDRTNKGSLEDPMVVLKTLAVAAVAFLTLFSMLFVMRGMQAAKVRVRPRAAAPQRPRRLRQDPRSGIYYPED